MAITCGDCTAKCASTCTGSCEGDCSSRCADDCWGDCDAACKDDCEGSCSGDCGDDCWGSCSGDCEGCTGSCQGSCQGSCKGCTGQCTGQCNAGCTNSAQESANNAIINMSNMLNASEAITLRNYINSEMAKRGKTQNTNTVEAYKLAKAEWWNSLRTTLAQSISLNSSSAATSGETISLSDRQDIIDKAKTLYGTTVPIA